MQPTKIHILYTEDHEDTREYVSLLLRLHNYELTTTANATEALRLAQNNHFDLYLLDAWLPDISGFELCQRIRQFDANTPILFYSAAAYEMDKQEALSCGAQEYLTKPDGVYELPEAISRLVRDSQLTSIR